MTDLGGRPQPSPPGAVPRRRLPRWAVNLLALPGVFCSAIAGVFVVDWNGVYGTWPADGHEFDALAYVGLALVAGLMVWVLALSAAIVRTRKVWPVLLAGCLLAPALVLNVSNFLESRQRVCEIRASNGPDPRLHAVPWPLVVHCSASRSPGPDTALT